MSCLTCFSNGCSLSHFEAYLCAGAIILRLFWQTDVGDSAEDFRRKYESWLPVTGARNGKWYYSAFHNITAMVGAGVLGLPSAFSYLGWYVKLSYTPQILSLTSELDRLSFSAICIAFRV